VGTLFQILLLGGLIKRATGKTVRLLVVPQNNKDLRAITELCVAGKIKPVIDKRYPLQDAQEAMRYILAGYAKGKVVLTVHQDGNV
jgi:NADPH:quinone reductase-like Zn-dependent oxidoreductase